MSLTHRKYLAQKQPSYLNQGGSTANAIKDSLISGFSTGIGFSISDRLVSAVLGPKKVEVQQISGLVRSPDCEDINKIYKEFIYSNKEPPSFIREAYEKCNSFQS